MDKNLLFKPRLDEAEVEIPGVGTVRVRALSRDEVFGVQQIKGTEAAERRILSLAMVDPTLTETEVFKWQQASPAGELEAVTTRIQELSGMTQGASKSGLPGAGTEPGPGVRDVPGDEAGDDGGPPADRDEQ